MGSLMKSIRWKVFLDLQMNKYLEVHSTKQTFFWTTPFEGFWRNKNIPCIRCRCWSIRLIKQLGEVDGSNHKQCDLTLTIWTMPNIRFIPKTNGIELAPWRCTSSRKWLWKPCFCNRLSWQSWLCSRNGALKFKRASTYKMTTFTCGHSVFLDVQYVQCVIAAFDMGF